jgi:uncharacterized FAD-dependent dehydrogenase
MASSNGKQNPAVQNVVDLIKERERVDQRLTRAVQAALKKGVGPTELQRSLKTAGHTRSRQWIYDRRAGKVGAGR